MPPSIRSHDNIKRQFISLGRPDADPGSNKKHCRRYSCKHCPWEGSASSPSRLDQRLDICVAYNSLLPPQNTLVSSTRASVELPPKPSHSQKKITESGIDVISKHEREAINEAAATAVISDGRSFGLFESFRFHQFFQLLRPGWKPLTRRQITSRLPDIYTKLQETVLERFRGADHISIIFDASDNVSHHRIVNISVKPPESPAFYWKTFDTGDKQHTADIWVTLLWPELLIITNNDLSKINSICTDTEATMRSVHHLLEQKTELQHVNFSLCDSHGLQLLIKDILSLPPFEGVVSDSNTIITFFSRSKLQLGRLRTCQRVRWNGVVRALIRRSATTNLAALPLFEYA